MNSILHHNKTNKFETYSLSPNGILKINQGIIAHTGILEYPEENLYVDKDTLFELGHIRSLEGSYITVEHPDDKVTPYNAHIYAVGTVGKVKQNTGDNLIAELIIWHINGIKAIMNGYSYLSEAYFAKKVYINGKPTQRHRKTNHVALTKTPRAKNAYLILSPQKQKSLVKDSNKNDFKNYLVSMTL